MRFGGCVSKWEVLLWVMSIEMVIVLLIGADIRMTDTIAARMQAGGYLIRMTISGGM